jgi:hypothetical protein
MRFVVDLDNYDQNIESIIKVLESIQKAARDQTLEFKNIDIKKEIQNLQNFKNNLLSAISNSAEKQQKEKEACEKQQEEGEEKKYFATDRYGNVFSEPPFQYSHAEIDYENVDSLQVRLLGNAFLIPVRYYAEGLKVVDCSGTVLKILADIEGFTDQASPFVLTEKLREINQEIEDRCEYPASKPKKPSKVPEWRQKAEKYFDPYPIIGEPKKEEIEKIKQEKQNNKKSSVITPEEVRQLESGKAQKRRDKEKIYQNLEIESRKEEPKPIEQKKDLVKCEEETPEEFFPEDYLKKEAERVAKFLKEQSMWCLIKEARDCYIPQDVDFCEIIFKDISVTSFYKKLNLLKAPGTTAIIEKIEATIEENFGINELREKADRINRVKDNIEQDKKLKGVLLERQEEYNHILAEKIEQLADIEKAIRNIGQKLSQGLILPSEREKTGRRKRAKERQKEEKLQEMEDLKTEILFLANRLRTLDDNIERRENELESLEAEYGERIASSQLNEEQSDLILQGRNLEAVLLSMEKNEQQDGLTVANNILNIVDTVMPLENLCTFLFQVGLSVPKFELPPNLMDKFFNESLKHPFEGMYSKFSRLIITFIINAAAAVIQSLLTLTCDTLDKLAASQFGPQADGENPIDLGAVMQKAMEQTGNILKQNLSNEASRLVSFGAPEVNAQLDVGLNLDFSGSVEDFNIVSNNPIAANLETDSTGVFDFLGQISNSALGTSSALSEWYLSPDKKRFIYAKQPPLVDFTQIDNFINTSFAKLLQDLMGSGEISPVAFKDSMGEVPDGESDEPDILISPPTPVELSLSDATSEIVCLINRVISVLPPSESMPLMNKKGSQYAKNITLKLAEICAPNLLAKYPGDQFIPNVIGEIGIASGASQILKYAEDFESNNLYPEASDLAVCDIYDNTYNFLQDLMSETIPQDLAEEILSKIDDKRKEQFNYIIDAFSGFAEGTVPSRPQDAKQFYSEVIEKMVEAEKSSQTVDSLESLNLENQQNQQPLSLEEQAENLKKKLLQDNPTYNAVLDLTADSMIRPIKNAFSRDLSFYNNSITSKERVEKPVSRKQNLLGLPTPDGYIEGDNSSTIDMNFKSMVDANMIPCIHLKKGKLRLASKTIQDEIQREIDIRENKIQDIESLSPERLDWKKDLDEEDSSVYDYLIDNVIAQEKNVIDILDRNDNKDGEEVQNSQKVRSDKFRKPGNFPYRLESVERPVVTELVHRKIPPASYDREETIKYN